MVLEIKYVREIECKVELKKMDVEMIRYKMKHKDKSGEKTVKIKHKEKTENLKDKENMIKHKKGHRSAGPQTAKPNTLSSSSGPASNINITATTYQNILKTEDAEKKEKQYVSIADKQNNMC